MAYRLTSSFKPYFRFEQVRPHGNGKLAPIEQLINWRTVFTTGLRHDFTESAAIKLQWERSSDQYHRFSNGAAVQLAFTF